MKDLFPSVFEKKWEEVLSSDMTITKTSSIPGYTHAVYIKPEDHFLPFRIQFVDTWRGDREGDNPKTDYAVYKIKDGKVYRKKR